MGVDLIGEVYVSIGWGRAGRGRDAEELDRFNVEILLDVMDLLGAGWTLVVGRVMSFEILVLGLWQALAVEADFALLVHDSDGVLALEGVHNLQVIEVWAPTQGLLSDRSLLAVARLLVVQLERGQLQLLDVLRVFLQRMQIHVSGAVAGRAVAFDFVLHAVVEPLGRLLVGLTRALPLQQFAIFFTHGFGLLPDVKVDHIFDVFVALRRLQHQRVVEVALPLALRCNV